MLKFKPYQLVIFFFFFLFNIQAGERTIPVDIILMIDKSLSMAEPGKFQNMHQWVRNHLIGQMLINEDWITIYQFYGKTDHLLTMTLKNQSDRSKITDTIDSIQPDGHYTDVGLALDTIKLALEKRGTTGRHKIMLLLTDLKQEAPWTSKYAGTKERFESPYLAEARILKHEQWFEITLDMDIQDSVVKTSQELFSAINETAGSPPDLDIEGSESSLDAENGIAVDVTETIGTKPQANSNVKSKAETGSTLPLSRVLVVLSVIIFAVFTALVLIFLKRKNERKDAKKSLNG